VARFNFVPFVMVVSCAGVACATSEGSGFPNFKADSGHDGGTITPGGDTGSFGLDTGSSTTDPHGTPSEDSGTSAHDSGSGYPHDSGSSPDPDTGSGFPTWDSGSPTPYDTGTGSPPPGGGTDDSTCGAMGTYDDCATCCGTNHPDGYDGFITALADCACTKSVCESKCSTTFCASTPTDPTTSCSTCLDDAQSGACASAISTACGSGGPCEPYADCVTTQCSALP